MLLCYSAAVRKIALLCEMALLSPVSFKISILALLPKLDIWCIIINISSLHNNTEKLSAISSLSYTEDHQRRHPQMSRTCAPDFVCVNIYSLPQVSWLRSFQSPLQVTQFCCECRLHNRRTQCNRNLINHIYDSLQRMFSQIWLCNLHFIGLLA